MRKFMISLAAAGSVLAIATPAAAQYYPQQQQPYAAPYGNAYGYNNNNYGQVRSLEVRINAIQRQIQQLDRRDRIRNGTADRLRHDANNLEQRLRHAARDGMNYREANDIQIRLARLEQQVRYSVASNGRGWNNNNGYNNYDRDRDGRDDRYEDDQGYQRDR